MQEHPHLPPPPPPPPPPTLLGHVRFPVLQPHPRAFPVRFHRSFSTAFKAIALLGRAGLPHLSRQPPVVSGIRDTTMSNPAEIRAILSFQGHRRQRSRRCPHRVPRRPSRTARLSSTPPLSPLLCISSLAARCHRAILMAAHPAEPRHSIRFCHPRYAPPALPRMCAIANHVCSFCSVPFLRVNSVQRGAHYLLRASFGHGWLVLRPPVHAHHPAGHGKRTTG